MCNCPLCGLNETKIWAYFKKKVYLQCGRCALVFLGTVYLGDEKVLYNNEYIRKRGHDLFDAHLIRAKKKTASHYLSFLERYATKADLLDIGCSTGIVLKSAQERGWGIYGIEINKDAALMARKFLNTDTIEIAQLCEHSFQNKFFSAILMVDVLEHLNNPLEYMKILQNKLKPKGILFLLTPNVNSLSAKLMRERWPHLFLEHVCLYSPKSIQFLLSNVKFRILKIGWAVKYVNLDMLKRHFQCHPDTFLSKTMLRLLNKSAVLNKLVFPLNVGEMFVLAQKQ